MTTNKIEKARLEAIEAQARLDQLEQEQKQAERATQQRISNSRWQVNRARAKDLPTNYGRPRRLAYNALMDALTTGSPDPYPLWVAFAQADVAHQHEQVAIHDIRVSQHNAEREAWEKKLAPLNQELFNLSTLTRSTNPAPVRTDHWTGQPLPNQTPNETVLERIEDINKQLNTYRAQVGLPADRQARALHAERVEDYIPKAPATSESFIHDTPTFAQCQKEAYDRVIKDAAARWHAHTEALYAEAEAQAQRPPKK